MVKKSVRAGPPGKKKRNPPPGKNSKTRPPFKRKQVFPIAGIQDSISGFEAFKTLAENAPDVIYRVDRNLRFVFVNRKVSEFTGIPSEQFFGKTLLGLGLPKDFSFFWGKKVREIFKTEEPKEFEFTFDGPEGSRWFHSRIVPEFDHQGNMETVLGIAHEITDLKRAELDYKEERAFRDSITSSLRIGIAAVDPEGRQSYVNPSFCEMVGWSQEELEGAKPPFVYWPPEEIRNIAQAFQQVLSGENTNSSMELRFRRRNGERFDALVLSSPYKDGQGNVIGWIASIGDITQQKKKDEEIRKLNFELEQRIMKRTAELEAANKRLQEAEQKSRLQLAELETIYDSTPVGLCVFDSNLTYLRINKRMAEINGVPAEDHIGRTPWEIVPEIADQAEALLRQVLETGQPIRNVEVNGETPAQPGGLHTWLEHWLPLKNESGEVIGINVVTQEITERKRAEDALRESEERFRALVMASSDVVYRMSPDWNEMRVLYGRDFIPDTDAPSRTWLQKYIHPDDQSHVMAVINQAIRTKSIFELEHRVLRVDGSLGWTFSRAIPLLDANGEVLEWFGTASDITERKQSEKEIKTLNEDLRRRTVELENANKELEAFTYSVSHDLRAPLIVASGFCRRLSERYGEKIDDRGKHYLQRLQEACQNMRLLIEGLLNLSKATTTPMKFKSVDLSDLAKSIATQLKATQPKRELHFLIEEGLTAKGDSQLLKTVLENLFTNAWKFTAKSKRAKIGFGLLKRVGEEPIYFVRDNGCGFDMSVAGALFKPFQRLHTDEEFPGTGVGLASVHRIITRHGGRIWAESAVGKGTTFFFTLPAQ